MSSSIRKVLAQREQERIKRRLLEEERLRTQGLAGRKLGKHRVPEEDLQVQLGDELSETLRGMKVEPVLQFSFCATWY